MTADIITDRLILKPLDLAYASAIQEKFNNWEIIKHIGGAVPWPYPDNGGESFLHIVQGQIEKNEIDYRHITLKHSGDLIGGVDITFPVNKGRQFAPNEVGYWLAEDFWGQGYMTEAVKGIIASNFSGGFIDQVSSRAATNNKASQMVLEKVGFKKVDEKDGAYHSGCTREYCYLLNKEDAVWIN